MNNGLYLNKKALNLSIIAVTAISSFVTQPSAWATDSVPYEVTCSLAITQVNPYRENALPIVYLRTRGSRIAGSSLEEDEVLELTRRDIAVTEGGEEIEVPRLAFARTTVNTAAYRGDVDLPTLTLNESELRNLLMTHGGLSELETEDLEPITITSFASIRGFDWVRRYQVRQDALGWNSFRFNLNCSDGSRFLNRWLDGRPFRRYERAQALRSTQITDENIRVIQEPAPSAAPSTVVQPQARE